MEELERLVRSMLDNLANCTLDSGCCHCGEEMNKHSEPMNCGHTPVDMGWTAADEWIKQAQAALAKLELSKKEGTLS